MPLLSICIPVYNGEKYIGNCLEPLVKMDDVEIICVDDGSKDNSLVILTEYKNKYDNIIVMSQTNQGQSSARTRALEVVSGKYVAFVDVDDWLETRAITFLKEIDSRYCPDFVQFGVVSEYDGWNSRKKLLYPESKLLNEKESKELYAYVCGLIDDKDIGHDYFGLVSCKFYKTDVIKNIRFVSNIVGEDTLFASEAGTKITSTYFLSEYLYHYTSSEGSYSHSIMKDIIPKSERMLVSMKKVMEIDDSSEELIRKAFYNRCFYMFEWCLRAMGFYMIKEPSYQHAVLSEILSKPIYRELFNNLDIIYTDEHKINLINFVKSRCSI